MHQKPEGGNEDQSNRPLKTARISGNQRELGMLGVDLMSELGASSITVVLFKPYDGRSGRNETLEPAARRQGPLGIRINPSARAAPRRSFEPAQLTGSAAIRS
jgi:hypothetical protein